VAGLTTTKGGDNRFYNNVFIGRGDSGKDGGGFGLSVYDQRHYPLHTGGNVFYNGARHCAKEVSAMASTADPNVKLVQEDCALTLHLIAGPEFNMAATRLVTTELLGKAEVPQLGYENADGSPLKIDTDFFGKKRSQMKPTPGPFEKPGLGPLTLKIIHHAQ
jgi:hypothetical protein